MGTRLSPVGRRLIRSAIGMTSAVLAATIATSAYGTVTCTTPQSRGAEVDDFRRCSAFLQFAGEDSAPDPRVSLHLKVAPGNYARSIVVIVGVSRYNNPDFNEPAAAVDVVNLADFFINDQKFDEVIVLRDKDATIDNIRYFLRTYAMRRAAFYRGKVRFVFAYSGHGVPMQNVGDVVPIGTYRPSVGLALANAQNDRDLENIYGLNELRPLLADVGKNTYHFLALINACYGGDMFGEAFPGNRDDPESRSSWGITAGADDQKVITLGAGHGSLFFDTLLEGIRTGEADIRAREATLGVRPMASIEGIVRLGPLDTYINDQINETIAHGTIPADKSAGNLHHWSGAIVPDGGRSLGIHRCGRESVGSDAIAREKVRTTR